MSLSGPDFWADARGADVDLAPLLVGPAKSEPATFASWCPDWFNYQQRGR